MQLLIACAAPLANDAWLERLVLPNLNRWLKKLTPTERLGSGEYTLTPPHERAFADAIELRGADGLLPWGAYEAQRHDLDTGSQAWGLLTPCHWNVGSDQMTMADPQLLDLSADESRQLLDAIRPLFDSEGWQLHYATPTQWFAAHESLREMPTASLDRVIGRNVDRWLPRGTTASAIRRLQSEVQMVLYAHPLHDDRIARGVLPVNSVWLSGCGAGQKTNADASVKYSDALRGPLFAQDADAWLQTWAQLDASLITEAQNDPASTLVLCGERFAQRFEPKAKPLWQRITRSRSRVDLVKVLQAL